MGTTAERAVACTAVAARSHSARRTLERALTPGAGLAAALPVIVSTARALAAGWMPVGDQGIIATRAYDVLSSHSPLVGQYSQASTVAGHPLYSPGPMLYWLLALPARLGTPGTLAVAMGLVNAASIYCAVALARRRGGIGLMLAAALGLALMCRSLSAESLHAIFNPAAAVLPLTLLIFVCWSIACGAYRLLAPAVVVASYVAQCHLAYVLPTAGMLIVALSGLGLTLRSRERRRRAWPWIAAALVAVAICWAAPLGDQIAHRNGNLGLIARAATSRRTTQGATAGLRVAVRAVGIPPRWLRAPQTTARELGDVSGGDYGDTRLNDVWASPHAATTASAVLVLVGLFALGLVGIRRRRTDLTSAVALAFVLTASLWAVVATTPASATNTLGYTTWWDSAAGMWAWFTLAWGCATLVRPLRLPAPIAALGVAAVALAGALVGVSARADAHTPVYRPTGALAGRLGALPRGRTAWLVQRGFVVVPIEPAIRFALRRRGIRALGNLAMLRLGAWYELDHRRYDFVVSVYGADGPPISPVKVIAGTTVTDRRGRHPVTLAVSRRPRRRRGAAGTVPLTKRAAAAARSRSR